MAEPEASDAVSSLPSGEPLDAASVAPPPAPSTSPSKPSPPPKTPKPQTKNSNSIAATLLSAPRNADAFISHLHRCAQSRGGADVCLLFLTYALRLSSAALDSASRSALRHSARRLVAAAFQLPPKTTVVLSSVPSTPQPAAFMLKLAGRLNAASAMLGEWRTMGRLWGLLGLYMAMKGLLAKSLSKPSETEKTDTRPASEKRFDTFVAYAGVISLISYQSAENAAFLSGKNVLGLSPATQAKLGKWSVRSWAFYVGLQLGRLLVERSRRKQKIAAGDVSAEDEDEDVYKQEWFKEFSTNLAWAPLTLHWGFKSYLSEFAVAALACYPAADLMKDLWKSTA